MGDDEDDDTDADEETTVTYRVEAPESDWHEFKTNVPHSITLGDKILDLIREFNDAKRNRNCKQNGNHNGNGDTQS